MADRYNIRNVAQKEVYDSYMGILRISPNADENGKWIDDPTQFLTDIDGDGVQLSDSDGNMLPIIFKPRVFPTKTFNTTEEQNIINICTLLDAQLYVSKDLTSRSTIFLTNPSKSSKLVIVSGGKAATADNVSNVSGILAFPTISPHDSYYFNNNNIFKLFDSSNQKNRAEQVEEQLLDKHPSWYETHISSKDKVKVNGKVVKRINNHNEEVPVLYSRDYVLGHYEGHALSSSDCAARKNDWIGETTAINTSDADITKLSWIRFDELIWKLIDQVVSGKVRHSEGRYSELGANGSGNIEKTLFNPIGRCSLSNKGSLFLQDTAPLLAKGVQEGMIMYHSMPFHRYLFHVCRQILQNNYGSTIQKNLLNECMEQGLITPCSMASITPHHSLVKDFLLCDGNEVNIENFPNISNNNEKLLKKTNGKYQDKNATEWDKSSVYKAIQSSTSNSVYIKLPNLYSFTETYPRFIRGLNWDARKYDGVHDLSLEESYVKHLTQETLDTIRYAHTNREEVIEVKDSGEKDEWGNSIIVHNYIGKDKDRWGNIGIDISKPITEVNKIYPPNYDFGIITKLHRHHLFSSVAGGKEEEANFTENRYVSYSFKTIDRGSLTHEYTYDKKKKITTGSLRDNYIASNTEYGSQWLNYGLNRDVKFFHGFTPISNLGLYLWNADIYNRYVRVPKTIKRHIHLHRLTEKFEGTKSFIEDGNSSMRYFDSKGNTYTFDANSNFIIKKIEITDEMTPDEIEKANIENKIQKLKRKQQAIKLNEFEMRLPISYTGFARYQVVVNHRWYRKKKGSGKEMEHGAHYFRNACNYELKSFPKDKINYGDNSIGNNDPKTGWSCVTSLPYTDTEYLAFGNWANIKEEHLNSDNNSGMKYTNPSEYYINHNVTDVWNPNIKNGKYQMNVNYGDTIIKADTSAPSPSHIYLLPLIRL